jgi:hypothetical protein
MFYPLINRPTRITAHSATLIDNIFTNNLSPQLFSGIILNNISDYLPVFVYTFTESSPVHENRNNHTVTRDYSENNIATFRTHLTNVDWSDYSDNGTNIMYNNFLNGFLRIYDLSFPVMVVKRNKNRPLMPWMTKALLVSTRKKNKLYKQFMAKINPARESLYKKYKNKLTHLIKGAKKAYYEKRFDAVKNNQKATWKLINEFINKRARSSSLPSSFKKGSCTLTDPKDIANSFCNFFANIGPELASKIPHHNVSFRSFLDLSYSESMFLCPTNKNELQDICYSFKTGKAPGFDNVSMYVIKKSFDLLVQPLANIINLSLCMIIFPEKLKIAKVIPIFKSGEQNSFTNYRPISLLSNFSKFFEKVMHNRLTSYIERHEILYSLQFGFQRKHSTYHSLISLTNNIASD